MNKEKIIDEQGKNNWVTKIRTVCVCVCVCVCGWVVRARAHAHGRGGTRQIQYYD